jgi:hypothetical protein
MALGHLHSPASKTLCRCICDCSWFRSSTSVLNRWSLLERPAVSGCETRIDAKLGRKFTQAQCCVPPLQPQSRSLCSSAALSSLFSLCKAPITIQYLVAGLSIGVLRGSSITLVGCRCRSISQAGPTSCGFNSRARSRR